MPAVIVAPNGARKNKKDHPALPMTLLEMTAEAISYAQAGVTMIHVHVRDCYGEHSLDLELNQKWANQLQKAVGKEMIVQLTTESIGRYSPNEIATFIENIQVPALSIAIKELLPSVVHYVDGTAALMSAMRRGTLIQYIVYTPQELALYKILVSTGVIPSASHHLLLVLGKHSTSQQAEPNDLSAFDVTDLNVPWAVCAFGQQELACLVKTIDLGGDVRIGFENNLYTANGDLAINNLAQIEALKSAIKDRQKCIKSGAEYTIFLKNRALAS